MNTRPYFSTLSKWLPSRGSVLFTLIAVAGLVLYAQRVGALPGSAASQNPSAASTNTFPYQGRLTDSSGNLVNDTVTITFQLYAAPTGGTALWDESWPAVDVSEGLFNVLLGSTTPIAQTIFTENDSLWLGISVGSDSEMTPRVQVGSVPYAVSALNAPEYSPYVPLYRPQTLDLTTVDPDLKGFVGGFTDGRYGYLVPWNNNNGLSGKVARVDLQNFTSGGVTMLDLTMVDVSLKGFIGGFSDGRYGYFVPQNNGTHFGKVVRVDLQNFTSGGVTVLDLTTVDSDLKGFWGGFTDGPYGYFVPYANGANAQFGKVVRVDLQNFTSSGVAVLDLTTVDTGLKGFRGGFTDGRYGYFVPFNNGAPFGKVARVDLQNFASGGVTVLDLTTVDPDLKGFTGGFSDKRYSYFVPHNNGAAFGKVARVDLQNFTSGGVTVLDLTTTDPQLEGFVGGFADGRYGYFVPNSNGIVSSGKVARLDLQNFAPSGVTMLDLTMTDPELKGFYGSFKDGRYGYFVPYANETEIFGKIVRIQLFFGDSSP